MCLAFPPQSFHPEGSVCFERNIFSNFWSVSEISPGHETCLLVFWYDWTNLLSSRACVNCARALFLRYFWCLISVLHQLVNFIVFSKVWRGEREGHKVLFSHFLLKGKNHSARSERQSPLIWVSGWGEEIRKDDRARGEEKEEQLHDLKWCWLDDIESSCAKVEESNAFSLSLSFPYSLPSLALFCLAAKPS